MIKKIIAFISAQLMFVPMAFAATMVSSYSVTIEAGETREMPPIVITSTGDGDISANFGIGIIIPPEVDATWEVVPVTMTGNAFDNGRIMLNTAVSYSADDLKAVHIPVIENFEAGDYVVVEDLVVKAGSEPAEFKLGMDLKANDVSNFDDIRTHTIMADVDAVLDELEARYSAFCEEKIEMGIQCLWAKIDLLYMQNILGETRVEGLEISERELELMEIRRMWPQRRYQAACIETETPASYCSTLSDDLDRLSYFLD